MCRRRRPSAYSGEAEGSIAGKGAEDAARAFPTLKKAASAGTSRADRRDGRVAEGARLESVYTGNRIVGSNPTHSASYSQTIIEYQQYSEETNYYSTYHSTTRNDSRHMV